MTESLTRNMYDQFVRGIAEGRKKNPDQVRTLIDDGPFVAEQALRAGLVDALAYEDQLDDQGAVSKSGTVEGRCMAARGMDAAPRRAARCGRVCHRCHHQRRRRVRSAHTTRRLGIDAAGKAIRAARADNDVRAIVVRIDSPGGSSIASDVIWRELTITRSEKPGRPLVASMSDLAASGGYYVAMAAPHIVAQPATLTGSIGIYGGKFVTGGTYEKLGANIEVVSIGRNAALESPDRRFTDAERAKVREHIGAFYQGFLQKVAASRKLTVERVDQIARGRVWTGEQARQHGLVDAVGGLDRAVALAKERRASHPIRTLKSSPTRRERRWRNC